MKKLIIYYLFILGTVIFACDPVEDRLSMGDAITIDQLTASVNSVIVEGKNGNLLIVENNSPTLSRWYINGASTSSKAYDTLMVVSTGSVDIMLEALNPDGSTIEKTFLITVDTLSTLPEPYKLLFGDPTKGVTSKKYVWDDTKDAVWGNGEFGNTTAPNWWTNDLAAMDGHDEVYGSKGYMIFDLKGMTLTKYTEDGLTSESGQIKLDLLNTIADYSIAHLSTVGVTVLWGINPNVTPQEVYEYEILILTETELVLAARTSPDGSEGWFWLFKVADE